MSHRLPATNYAVQGAPLRKIYAAAAIAALTVLPTRAQQQPPAAELPKLVENIDVRIINVDVVVTDRKGNPVKSLKKEDFELYENNRPVALSNFYEVAGGRAISPDIEPEPAPAPATPGATARQEVPDNLRRRIIFYVDNLSMAPFNRNRVFTQMKEFVK